VNAKKASTVADENEEEAYPHPRKNAAIIGHADAEASLLSAWHSGRMPHAWLITGTPGLGKATLAYRLARFVLKQGADAEAAGPGSGLFGDAEPTATDGDKTSLAIREDAPIFRRVAQASHSDLLSIERLYDDKRKKLKTDISVDSIRNVGHFLALTPGEGTWRVVIVDTADDMNANAANALLKVLEEPPSNSLIVLTSSMPGRLLPTLRSRCRRLDLKPVADSDLVTALDQMAPDASPDERSAAIALAAGSPGKALELLEAGGLQVFNDLMAALGAIAQGRPDSTLISKVMAVAAKADNDAALRVFFDTLETTLHGVCAIASGVREPTVGTGWGHPLCLPVCERLAAQGSLDSWLAVWDNLKRARGQLFGLNLDRRQVGLSVLWSIEQAATQDRVA